MMNLVGERYGRLTVIAEEKDTGKKGRFWRCKCDCGNETVVSQSNLRCGNTVSCGCRKKEIQTQKEYKPSGQKAKELVGQKFGKLTVMEFVGIQNRKSMVKCKCDCGRTTIVSASVLKQGVLQSCGCLSKEYTTHAKMKNYMSVKGKKFGLLTVVGFAGVKNHRSMVHCKCDCGNEIDVEITRLKNGFKKSCGCLKKRKKKDVNKTLIEKYGITHIPVDNSEEIKEKMKQTLIEKYGIVNEEVSKEIREKAKKTFLEKYGVPIEKATPDMWKDIHKRVEEQRKKLFGN